MQSRATKVESLKEYGGIVVEVVMMIPIFLLGMLLVVWLGTTLNAKTGLNSAVGNAVRLALTRGDIGRNPTVSSGYDEVATWLLSDQLSNPTSWAKDRLASSDILAIGNPFVSTGWYSRMWNQTFIQPAIDFGGGMGSVGFKDLPPHYILALIYSYSILKEEVGSIKYPCDPWGNGPHDGPGCVRCMNLHASSATPCSPNVASLWDPISGDCTGGANTGIPAAELGGANYSRSWVGVRCEFRPDYGLLEPINGLLTLLSGGGLGKTVLVKQQFFSVSPVQLSVS